MPSAFLLLQLFPFRISTSTPFCFKKKKNLPFNSVPPFPRLSCLNRRPLSIDGSGTLPLSCDLSYACPLSLSLSLSLCLSHAFFVSHCLVVVVSFEDPLASFVLRSVPALKVTLLWDPWRIVRLEANSGGGREGGEERDQRSGLRLKI